MALSTASHSAHASASEAAPTRAAAAAAAAPDYATEVRNLFGVSYSDASSDTLTAILASPAGDQLRTYVDLAEAGIHAEDPSNASADAVAQLKGLLIQYGTLTQLVESQVSAIRDLTIARYGSAGLLRAVTLRGDVNEGLGQANQALSIIHDFVAVTFDPDRRALIREYRDFRDSGDDPADARVEMKTTFDDIIKPFERVSHLNDDDFYQQMEALYQDLQYSTDPDRVQLVHDFVTGLAQLQDFYQTGAPAAKRGLVMIPGTDGTSVSVVNDGPADLSGVTVRDDDGKVVLGPLSIPADTATIASTSGSSLTSGSKVTFQAAGLPVSLSLSDVYTTLWAGQPELLPGAADGQVHFLVDDPHRPVSAAADAAESWDFGDGTTGAGPTPDHTYSCPGMKNVGLTITGSGKTVTRSLTYDVPSPYRVEFNYVGADGFGVAPNVDLELRADRSIVSDPDLKVSWDFGDGQTAKGSDVTHHWTSPASYPVRMTVSSNGCYDQQVVHDVAVGTSTDWVPLPSFIPQGTTTLDSSVAGWIVPQRGMTVVKGAVLVLAPGTVIKGSRYHNNFGETGGAIDDQGSIVVNGTQDAPVILTSLLDDSAGGDANGDGDATTPAPADWPGVAIGPGATLAMTHAVVRYADGLHPYQDPGAITVNASTFENDGATLVDDAATLGPVSIRGTTTMCTQGETALLLQGATTSPVTLDGDTFVHCRGSAMYLTAQTRVAATGTTFDDTPDAADMANGSSDSTFVGSRSLHGASALHVYGGLPPVVTHWSGDLPYVVMPSPYWAPNASAHAVLEIDPGVVVKFGSTRNEGGDFPVAGTVVVAGTADHPVVLTTTTDDSAGGDTNGDGDATSASTQGWGGFYVGGSLSMSHADLRHASRAADLTGQTATASIVDSTLSDTCTAARSADVSGGVDLERTVVSGCGYGTYLVDVEGSEPYPVKVVDNTFTVGDTAVFVSGAVQPVIRLNRFDDVTYGVGKQYSAAVDGTANWWGSPDGPAASPTTGPRPASGERRASVQGAVSTSPFCADESCAALRQAPPPAPPAPTDVAAYPGHGRVRVSFSEGDADSVTSYVVTETEGDDVGSTTTVPAPATVADVTGLTDGVGYRFTVSGQSTVDGVTTDGETSSDTPTVVPRAVDGEFVPLTPARILDTRNGDDVTGGSPVGSGPAGQLTLHPLGLGGLPLSGVRAVVMNLTAVDASVNTFVSALSAAASDAPTTSNLNLGPGGVKAVQVTVPLAADGTLTLYNHLGTIDLVADVEGYYQDASGLAADRVHVAAPQRLLDTRDGMGVPGGGAAPIGPDGVLEVPVSGHAGVPAGAKAAIVNVTAVDASAATYLTAYQGGGARTGTSTLNLGPGQAVANLATIPLTDDGRLSLYNAQGTVDAIIDVVGWTTGPSDASGARYAAADPVRVLDTRTGLGAAKGRIGPRATVAVDVGAPAGAVGVLVNVTSVSPSASTYLSLGPAGAPSFDSSTLNSGPGDVVSNAAVSALAISGTIAKAVGLSNDSGDDDGLIDIEGYLLQ